MAQITPLVYPILVVVAPGWGYDGWLNWSSGIDLVVDEADVGCPVMPAWQRQVRERPADSLVV